MRLGRHPGGAVDGRFYRSRRYARYIVYNNLLVDDTAGDRITVRDGIYADYVDGATQRAYLSDGQVLALPELQPVEARRHRTASWLADPEDGRLCGHGRHPAASSPSGGGQATLLPPEPASLPVAPCSKFCRRPPTSTTARCWSAAARAVSIAPPTGARPGRGCAAVCHHIGLDPRRFSPDRPPTTRSSPSVTAGTTLGRGRARSTDSGDTWARRWHGLEHLRIQDLRHRRPTGTIDLLATAGATGYGRSRRVLAAAVAGRRRNVAHGHHGRAAARPARAARRRTAVARAAPPSMIRRLEVTVDGVNWIPAPVTLEPDARVLAVVAAPDAPATLYVLTGLNVYRTPDAGMTWQRWDDAPERPHVRRRTVGPDRGAEHDRRVTTSSWARWPASSGLDPASMTWRDATASPLCPRRP
ncbi:MAG: hypothetical protein R2854_13260 [Caldilineaceae bacterium]